MTQLPLLKYSTEVSSTFPLLLWGQWQGFLCCNTNRKTFGDKVINLSRTSLTVTVYDVECVAFFTSQEVEEANIIFKCHILDHGLRVLLCDLMNFDVTVTHLDSSANGLARSSSSFVSDLTIHCTVEELWITGNHTIGEEPAHVVPSLL